MAPHQGNIRCCEKNGGEAVNLELLFFRITVIIYVHTKIFKVVI